MTSNRWPAAVNVLPEVVARAPAGVEVCSAMILRRGDLGAALGVPSRLALPEQAGANEARDGQHENQRYRCDLSRPHVNVLWNETEHLEGGDAVVEADLLCE
jgi:hypothetical protein